MNPFSIVIQLIKTPNGYSLIQNEEPINRVSSSQVNQSVPAQNSQSAKLQASKQKPVPVAHKKFIPQQNFTLYPYLYNKQSSLQRYLIIPSNTQWFNLNTIHQNQRKALPQWFKQKKGASTTINNLKFQKNQQLYKKYRNHIIDLGKSQYVSPLLARKGLAGDACSIIRIHDFLEKWGLVNYVHKKPTKIAQENAQNLQNGIEISQNESTQITKRIKDGFDRDKNCIVKSFDKDDLELLKKITRKFRPVCNSCQSICGVSWYQYDEKLLTKYFCVNQKTRINQVSSGQNFDYHLRVCYACFNQSNFPVVLNFQNFNKKSVVDGIHSINFDKKYNKKKFQQFLKISETIEKNKFNISKSSQILKMSQFELLETLLQMPIQTLQKMSRIQPETQDQSEKISQEEIKVNEEKNHQNLKPGSKGSFQSGEDDINIYKQNLIQLDRQQIKIYEQFLQSWLMKIYSKMQHLERWDKSIQWRLVQNQQMRKYNLAQKLKANFKDE